MTLTWAPRPCLPPSPAVGRGTCGRDASPCTGSFTCLFLQLPSSSHHTLLWLKRCPPPGPQLLAPAPQGRGQCAWGLMAALHSAQTWASAGRLRPAPEVLMGPLTHVQVGGEAPGRTHVSRSLRPVRLSLPCPHLLPQSPQASCCLEVGAGRPPPHSGSPLNPAINKHNKLHHFSTTGPCKDRRPKFLRV